MEVLVTKITTTTPLSNYKKFETKTFTVFLETIYMWSPLRTILLEKHKKGNDETPSQPSVIPWTTCSIFWYPFFL